MKELRLKVIIDWDNYDDVADELILEDTGILDNLIDGVKVSLITAPTDEDIMEYARTKVPPLNWENLNVTDEAYYYGIIEGAKAMRDGLLTHKQSK